MDVLVVASHNAKKGREMTDILGSRFPQLQIRTLADYPPYPEPEERGLTYQENAVIKAEAGTEATGEWCVADDAGLEIDFLNGEPGLYSRRFLGEETPFAEKMQWILEKMKNTPETGRGARFRVAVALSALEGRTTVFEAICEGRIAHEMSGGGGFGYDPIFYLPELGCTMADLTAEQKHRISHRGKVLKLLADYIAELSLPASP